MRVLFIIFVIFGLLLYMFIAHSGFIFVFFTFLKKVAFLLKTKNNYMLFSILFVHVRKMLYLCTLNAPRALCARIYT